MVVMATSTVMHDPRTQNKAIHNCNISTGIWPQITTTTTTTMNMTLMMMMMIMTFMVTTTTTTTMMTTAEISLVIMIKGKQAQVDGSVLVVMMTMLLLLRWYHGVEQPKDVFQFGVHLLYLQVESWNVLRGPQSTVQPTNQSINQSINQSANQSRPSNDRSSFEGKTSALLRSISFIWLLNNGVYPWSSTPPSSPPPPPPPPPPPHHHNHHRHHGLRTWFSTLDNLAMMVSFCLSFSSDTMIPGLPNVWSNLLRWRWQRQRWWWWWRRSVCIAIVIIMNITLQ